jgi:hypothetical protein
MCFSIEWFVQLLIILVFLCGAIAILRIWVYPLLATTDPRIPATINIIIWVAVCIFVIYVVAYMLMCALGVGFPRLR